MIKGAALRQTTSLFWLAACVCAGHAVAQVSPCGSGQQLSSSTPVLSGTSTYWSPTYISSNNLSVNLNGNTVTGSANMTLQAGSTICFGPGFRVAGSSGRFVASVGSSAPPGAYAIAPITPPQGSVGAAYPVTTLTASGGTPSYSWSVVSGSLPQGLSLGLTTGQITGTPNTAGTFPFTVQATDALQATAVAMFSITVVSSLVTEIITTQPSGLSVTVDGSGYTSPATFQWQPGSQHSISTASPQNNGGLLPFTFAEWSDGGGASHTIDASASTIAATFSTITGPSTLHSNLSYLSFGIYLNNAASSGFTAACPNDGSGITVQSCFQTIMANLRQQGVSGVRIFVQLCDDNTTISPINYYDPGQGRWTGCSEPANVSFNGSSGPGQTWVQNAGAFFSDVASAGIQNVTITIAHGTPAGAPVNQNGTWGWYTPIASASRPNQASGGSPCQKPTNNDGNAYFWPSLPYGQAYVYDSVTNTWSYDILGHDEPESQGYNCAPINPYFIGWTNQFNAINALLGAAQGKVTINELDFEQELNLVDYTAELRYIYDNAQTSGYNGAYSGCSSDPVDIVCILRTLMSNHGFDSSRATWSSPHTDSTPADSACPSVDPTTGTCNCTDVYTDWARQSDLNAVASSFGGGLIGVNNATASSGLWCGGTVSGMLQVPIYHTQPDIVDVHMYPHVAGAGSGDTQVQQVATLDFNDLTHFLPLVYPNGPTPLFMIGETHVGTELVNSQCELYPPNAAASAVAGFDQSQFAGQYSIVLRPWMELEDTIGQCFPYPTYQNVNLNWGGPYAPSQH